MRKTRLENWICEVEGLSALDHETLEDIQLRRLNELLAREKARGGFYKGLPERLSASTSWGPCPSPRRSSLRKTRRACC